MLKSKLKTNTLELLVIVQSQWVICNFSDPRELSKIRNHHYHHCSLYVFAIH